FRFIARTAGMKWRYPKWQHVAFIGWAGMRGGDSLVIALSLPLMTSAGTPFPARDLIIFITFSVILITLVVQGFTFGAACRLLGIRDDGVDKAEEERARRVSLEAGLAHLEELAKRPEAPMEQINDLRDRHARRLHHLLVKDQPVLFPEKRSYLRSYRHLR